MKAVGLPPRTVGALWASAVAAGRPRPAFLAREGESWREITWQEAGERVDELAAGFLELGIERGDHVAIACRTRLEWTLCELALISIGAVIVPAYLEITQAELAYILADSGSRAVICEAAAQVERVERVRGRLPDLEHVLAVKNAENGVPTIAELAARGRARLERQPDEIGERRAALGPDDVLVLLYTSGTTGTPKGCILTHGNWTAMVESMLEIEDFLGPGDVTILHLPLAHVFARLVQFVSIAVGITIVFVPDVTRVARTLEETNPTIFPTVPGLLERVQGRLEDRFAEEGALRRGLIRWALSAGARAARRLRDGRQVRGGLRLEYALADRLVLSKIRARFGGRLRLIVSGGAPLRPDVAEFLESLGFLVLEGYGLTECTAVATVNRPHARRLGTVGPPAPGVEVGLADDGEILVRGPTVFRGYHGSEEKTAEALTADGWLLTGDIGELDTDGFLSITDRKKDLIVTSVGANIAPQPIEALLKASPLISQAVVVGDRRPHLGALIALDPQAAAGRSREELERLVEEIVREINDELGPEERVRRFVILPRELSQEQGELTPTLKPRRKVCAEHFRDEIERLYRR